MSAAEEDAAPPHDLACVLSFVRVKTYLEQVANPNPNPSPNPNPNPNPNPSPACMATHQGMFDFGPEKTPSAPAVVVHASWPSGR